mmetsp:Transcript_11167/g.26888  ORF Transcript_11167/g.26888 Transcript_11167/m.26888 type:complete len:90 (-) Transcript_11167:563-832(-)
MPQLKKKLLPALKSNGQSTETQSNDASPASSIPDKAWVHHFSLGSIEFMIWVVACVARSQSTPGSFTICFINSPSPGCTLSMIFADLLA